MKKLLCLTFICLTVLACKKDDDTLAQQTYVPDDNFEAYLEANWMGNGIANDDSVTTSNIRTESILYAGSKAISDLTGIEDFTGLTTLFCGSNQLTSLDLSNNTALTTLYCSYNQLTNLDLSNNTALTSLECLRNPLTSLDVSGAAALTFLNCNYNQLTSLDLSQNTALTQLKCSYNQLTSLDLSQHTALTQLECYHNQLTSLDLTQNTALTGLMCSSNQLTCLNIKNWNNNNITIFNSLLNPNLSCIQVNEPFWSTANWTDFDPGVTFSTNCNYPLGCF